MVFFYVPFALLYRAARAGCEWTRELIRTLPAARRSGWRVVFALHRVRRVRDQDDHPQLRSWSSANDLHTYFTVNSVFFDPNIFGRFLALVMILLAALLIYDRPQREQVAALVVLAVLWGGLLLTLSRSSLGALLVGLGGAGGAALEGSARRS